MINQNEKNKSFIVRDNSQIENSTFVIEKRLIGLCSKLLKDLKVAHPVNTNESFISVENLNGNILYFTKLNYSKDTGIFTLSELNLVKETKLSNLLHSESISSWINHRKCVELEPFTNAYKFKRCDQLLRLHLVDRKCIFCSEIFSYSLKYKTDSSANDEILCSLHHIQKKFDNCTYFRGTDEQAVIQNTLDSNLACSNSLLGSSTDLHISDQNPNPRDPNKLEYYGLLEKLLSSNEAVTILNQVKESSSEELTKKSPSLIQNDLTPGKRNKRGILESLLSPIDDDISQKDLSKLKTTSWLLSNPTNCGRLEDQRKMRKLSYEKPAPALSLKRSRHATTPGAIYQPESSISLHEFTQDNTGKNSLSELLSDDSKDVPSNDDESTKRIYTSTVVHGKVRGDKINRSSHNRGAIMAAHTAMKIASKLSNQQENDSELLETRKRLLSSSYQAMGPQQNDDFSDGRNSDDSISSLENVMIDHENHVPGSIHHYKKDPNMKNDPSSEEDLVSANNIKSVLKEIAPNRVLTKSDATIRPRLTPIMPKIDNQSNPKSESSSSSKGETLQTPIAPRGSYQILLPNMSTVYQIMNPSPQKGCRQSIQTNNTQRLINIPMANENRSLANASSNLPIIIYEPVNISNFTIQKSSSNIQPKQHDYSSLLSNTSKTEQTQNDSDLSNMTSDKSIISSPPIDMIVNTVLDLEQEIYSDPKETDLDIEKAANQFFKLPSLSAICKLPT